MKTTRMTVEGAKGWANITRREVAGKMVIAMHGDGLPMRPPARQFRR
jgi:hypothetical protein